MGIDPGVPFLEALELEIRRAREQATAAVDRAAALVEFRSLALQAAETYGPAVEAREIDSWAGGNEELRARLSALVTRIDRPAREGAV